MAGGKVALVAQKDAQDKMRIKLGNLGPLKEAKLTLQLIKTVPVEFGSYCFRMQDDFCPNYKKFGFQENPDYTFSIDLEIKSKKKIIQVSAPEES